ncbi:MAG: hypothetical protein J5966_05860 [Lachnospiraceae bacterium]|nr:hypothetical protein [Lachnospiraceae bacterium]
MKKNRTRAETREKTEPEREPETKKEAEAEKEPDAESKVKTETGTGTDAFDRADTEALEEDRDITEGGTFKAYLILPIVLTALVSAAEILILEQSVTGAVRNLIVVSVTAFAVCYSCSRHISRRTAVIMAFLGIAASLQAFLPGFIIPISAFGVLIALFAADAYTGAFSLFLFAAMPFLANEGSYEAFLFYTVTGMIGIALIYSRKEEGKYTEALVIYTLVYTILYTGLVILKRTVISPEFILAPIAGLILDIVIMEVSGYSYYTNIVKRERDLYKSVVDPEHPLLLKLKSNNKREYKRAIHTAHFTELFADKFGYDRVLMKGLGFYHRIGVLREEEDTSLTIRTLALAMEEEFPEDMIEALREYGEARPGQKVSAEVSITIIVDTVINSLMDEFSSGKKKPDLNRFIDKEILNLFSGKNSLLKKSAIPYYDLEEIRKHLKGERIYYDFLR